MARELAGRGHHVCVLTSEPSGKPDDEFPFAVVRTPSQPAIWNHVAWAQLVFQLGGLRLGWPLCFVRRKSVIVHHNWPDPAPARGLLTTWLRRRWSQTSRHICPSRGLQSRLSTPCNVIGNPYDDATFRILEGVSRDRDIIFVGRLLKEKGADLLLDALARLSKRGLRASVTVVGHGPELENCKRQTTELNLAAQVTFRGVLRGPELCRELNRHHILVVPSRWHEPFGIVALEGIASGCVVVGSAGGGLAEAIGACGVTFPNGNVQALAARLQELLSAPNTLQKMREAAQRHLTAHQPKTVMDRYLDLIA